MSLTVTSSTLQVELKQTKPFQGPEHEVYLSIKRAASELSQGVVELLKPAGLTGAQYNVLRILRGAGPQGLSCGEIGERLVTRDPDMTRLLDRMEKQGLISRARAESDRRVVTTVITSFGSGLLAGLDEPMAELHRRQLSHLGEERLRDLAELLHAAVKSAASDPHHTTA